MKTMHRDEQIERDYLLGFEMDDDELLIEDDESEGMSMKEIAHIFGCTIGE